MKSGVTESREEGTRPRADGLYRIMRVAMGDFVEMFTRKIFI